MQLKPLVIVRMNKGTERQRSPMQIHFILGQLNKLRKETFIKHMRMPQEVELSPRLTIHLGLSEKEGKQEKEQRLYFHL